MKGKRGLEKSINYEYSAACMPIPASSLQEFLSEVYRCLSHTWAFLCEAVSQILVVLQCSLMILQK